MHIFTSTYLGIIDNVIDGEAKLEVLGTKVCPGTSIYYLWKPKLLMLSGIKHSRDCMRLQCKQLLK